jgi:hypothetical protein
MNPRLPQALAFLASLCSLQGAVLVSNLVEPDTGNPAWVGSVGGGGIQQALAQSFIAGASAKLEDVTLSLIDSTTTTDFTVALYSDFSGSPAALLSTLIGDTNPSSGAITFADPASSLLTAGTTYWIVASAATSTGSKFWTVTASDSEQGEPGWVIGNVGKFRLDTGAWVASNLDSGAWQMSVNGSVVPEPSSTVLFALGLTAFFTSRRRIPNEQCTQDIVGENSGKVL